MIRTVLACLGVSGIAGMLQAAPQKADAALVRHLDAVYQHWRDSVIRRDIEKWQIHGTLISTIMNQVILIPLTDCRTTISDLGRVLV